MDSKQDRAAEVCHLAVPVEYLKWLGEGGYRDKLPAVDSQL